MAVKVVFLFLIAILVLAALAALAPTAVGWVIAAVLGWFGITTGIRAFLQARRARHEEQKARESLLDPIHEESTE